MPSDEKDIPRGKRGTIKERLDVFEKMLETMDFCEEANTLLREKQAQLKKAQDDNKKLEALCSTNPDFREFTKQVLNTKWKKRAEDAEAKLRKVREWRKFLDPNDTADPTGVLRSLLAELDEILGGGG